MASIWSVARSFYRAEPVTPDDDAEIEYTSLYIGETGDVTIHPKNNQSPVTLSAVPAGTILPIQVTKVLATGTNVTNIIGLRY